LRYIFNGYDVIRDSFLEINTLHKQGNITDREFFDKIQESIMRFSALEFLSIKSIFEIKKALDRNMRSAKNTAMTAESSASDIHVLSHSISAFIVAGTLPRSSSHMTPSKTENKRCIQCRSLIRKSSKFCVSCGSKI
ncbi:MAG: zinc ribbon domain-containing protein, partial [Nitrosotalea sp.]